MKFDYKFKNMESQQAAVDFCDEKIFKLEKYLKSALEAHFSFSTERHNYEVELTLSGKNIHYASHGKSGDIFSAIDQAVSKMCTQLSKKKSRIRDHKHKMRERHHNVLFLDDYREMPFHKKAN